MDFVQNELEKRKVPDALVTNRGAKVKSVAQMQKRRDEIKRILEEEEYGKLPPKPEHLVVDKKPGVRDFCAGKAINDLLTFTATINGKEVSFPVIASIPKCDHPVPAFVHINFRADNPDRYMPTEEIIDGGFAVFSLCYQDIALDNGDFKSKLARHLCSSRRAKSSSGKIMMWAWAAMRVMDYIMTLPEIDHDNVAVIGHSRLGKTALVTAAFDERFKYAISNDSGCSGAAISRDKEGESIERITNVFPYWFCPRYAENTDPFEKSYDQNFLFALIPPRHIMVGSAKEDLWADPKSEFLNCAGANSVYKLYGMKGLVYGDDYPTAKSVLGEGDSLYHVRFGTHYLSREDWGVYMDFIRSKMNK